MFMEQLCRAACEGRFSFQLRSPSHSPLPALQERLGPQDTCTRQVDRYGWERLLAAQRTEQKTLQAAFSHSSLLRGLRACPRLSPSPSPSKPTPGEPGPLSPASPPAPPLLSAGSLKYFSRHTSFQERSSRKSSFLHLLLFLQRFVLQCLALGGWGGERDRTLTRKEPPGNSSR